MMTIENLDPRLTSLFHLFYIRMNNFPSTVILANKSKYLNKQEIKKEKKTDMEMVL